MRKVVVFALVVATLLALTAAKRKQRGYYVFSDQLTKEQCVAKLLSQAEYIHVNEPKKYAFDSTPQGTNKCNFFVHDVIAGAGFDAPTRIGLHPGPIGAGKGNFLNKGWADEKDFKGWRNVITPWIYQPGDIVAGNQKGFWHVGIVAQDMSVISAASSGVVKNDWPNKRGITELVVHRYC
jgi:hypothetical protein